LRGFFVIRQSLNLPLLRRACAKTADASSRQFPITENFVEKSQSSSNKWEMPPISLGPCLWYANRSDSEACPAVVTTVCPGSVNLTVIPPDNRGTIPKNGCRHISDPVIALHPNYDAGCWDYTNEQKRMLSFERRLAKIEDEITKLEATGTELIEALGIPKGK
jgi:hypothetical protein